MKRIRVKPLKVFMPKLVRIYASHECISPKFDVHYERVMPLGAHTHICSSDKYYKTICIWDEEMILNADGTPSDLMWHEYAHVLDADNFKETFKCGNPDHTYMGKIAENESLQDIGHGPSWRKIMKKLGQTPSRLCEGPKGKDIWSMYSR